MHKKDHDMGLILVLGFLALVLLTSGLILIYISKSRGRLYGYYMVVAAILLIITAVLLYTSGHYYYDQGVVYPTR